MRNDDVHDCSCRALRDRAGVVGARAPARLGLVLLLALLVPAPAAAGVPISRYWPVTKVMRAIDGKPVRLGTRTVRIASETTLCSGTGASIRVHAVRRWHRFRCTHTTITSRGLDRDLEFDVRILDAKRMRITNAAWVPDAR
jgi:hypothetical protein